MLPALTEILPSARVVALPLRRRFRGITVREALVFEGPEGWSEFSPFVEYGDEEASAWLRASIDFGFSPVPPLQRDRIRVNATLPAVDPVDVPDVLRAFPGCRTVKVKVAEPGQGLDADIARVDAARRHVGVEGRIRIDANGGWNVDEAEHAVHALARFDLEYIEQPCATVEDLAEIRQRVKYLGIPVAADESVRRATDPLEVVRALAADLLVIKAQPLGGIRSALAISAEAGVPVVVSSALDTSIGLAMGAHLAAALPSLDFDCGLGTAALLAADVTLDPLTPSDGAIPVRRAAADPDLLDRYAASSDRAEWWLNRLRRCYDLMDASV